MNKPLALFALALLAGAANAQGPEGRRQPSPEMQAFCAQHQQECAQLKSLHETARSICENKESKVGDCEAARSATRAQAEKMEAEGMPAPQHRGMGGREHNQQ